MKYLIDSVRVIIYSTRRELICISKSRLFISLLIVLPVLLFTFFCYFYSRGVLSDIKVGVFDADESELSRNIIRAIETSRSMKIVKTINNIDDIQGSLQNESLNGVIYFPKDLEKNLKKQEQVSAILYKNSQNTLLANAIYKETSLIFKSFNAGIILKKLKTSNMNDNQAMSIVQPVVTDIHYIGNPYFNYTNFLSPAYIYVCCQILLMLAGMFSITHEIDEKRYNRLIELAYQYTGALITGKCIAILSVFSVVTFTVHAILFPLFNITIQYPGVTFFNLTILYLIASLLPGIAIGALVKDAFMATEVIIFVNMPSLLISGYTFPAVPKILADISNILPFIHFMHIFIKCGQLSVPLKYVHMEIFCLLVITTISFIAAWLFIFKLNKNLEKTGI